MSFTSRSLLATMISLALYGPSVIAAESTTDQTSEIPKDLCAVPTQASSSNDSQHPIIIEADRVEAKNNNRASYEGKVIVTQGSKTVKANSVTLHQPENLVTAEGNVEYSDAQLIATSDKITANLNSENTTMVNTQYQLRCDVARGQAAHILKEGQTIYKMEDGSLTTCPADDNSWRFAASRIEYDQDEEWAEFYGARFEILDVPVFYTPYLTVPVGDKRKTGILTPNASVDSKNGFELSLPVYWNIAPNYDATTTVNYMEKRGIQLQNEFRYLTTAGSGTLALDYLNEDKKFLEKERRWATNWKHSGIYQDNWAFNVDFSRVSDVDYFTDLDSNLGSREDSQLLQSGEVAYRTENWDTTLRVRDFQTLTTDSTPYRLMPQLEFNYYNPEIFYALDFSMLSNISVFQTDDVKKPSATRAHFEPTLTLPLSSPWWTLTTEAKLLYTYYDQQFDLQAQGLTSDERDVLKALEKQTSRTIPEFRMHGVVYLERETNLFGNQYLQSLEPQAQYLYVPDVEQDSIYGAYDTTLLQTDYYGLFRTRKYSGIDRISSANQVSVGATTRFYDDIYKERLNVSFGQIYYLNTQKADDLADSEGNAPSYSAWALESDFNINDHFFFHGGFQYDTNISEVQLANSAFEYREGDNYVQLNYRYVTKDYIEDTINLEETDKLTRDGISQFGFVSNIMINRNWSAATQYYHDMNEDIMLEGLFGVNYTSDCWSVSLSYREYLVDWNLDRNTDPKYDDNISLSFKLQGLSTMKSPATKSFSGNSLGYSRPFYLNN